MGQTLELFFIIKVFTLFEPNIWHLLVRQGNITISDIPQTKQL